MVCLRNICVNTLHKGDSIFNNNNNNNNKSNKLIRWSNEELKEVLWRFMSVKEKVIPVVIGATGIVINVYKKFGSRTVKTLNRLTTKHSCAWDLPRNTEFTAV
jgi:predicted metal-dependent hydrolase